MKRKRYKFPYIQYDDMIQILDPDIHVEYTGIDERTRVIFICDICGEEHDMSFCQFQCNGFVKVCKSCRKKFIDWESVRKKREKTSIERYGHICDFSDPTTMSKYKKTCLERYGTEHYYNQEKVKQTCLEKYGVDNVFKSKEFQDKIKQTNLEKYGVDNPSKSEDVINKIKQSNLEKYGNECYFRTDEFKSKAKATNIKRYGCDHYNKTEESHKRRKTRIEYNGEYFDSKPEYEFYKKCIEEGMAIKRHPVRLEYEYDSVIHYYFPDFEVDGVLIEIKGKHFINPETGKWYNPFDHNLDKREEARYDCAIRNGVKIIYA